MCVSLLSAEAGQATKRDDTYELGVGAPQSSKHNTSVAMAVQVLWCQQREHFIAQLRIDGLHQPNDCE